VKAAHQSWGELNQPEPRVKHRTEIMLEAKGDCADPGLLEPGEKSKKTR